MKIPRPQFGIRSLLALTLLVGIACAAWPHLLPFCCLESVSTKGNLSGTDEIYVWRNGLAIGVRKFPGEWPSFSRRTVDPELLKEMEEALREEAELAQADDAPKAR